MGEYDMKIKKFSWWSLFVVMLGLLSLQTLAETQTGGRNFNHMTTGFPLSGGHASAACETCHTGGVFKGTPRTCDGCHAVGRRIVATPKSSSHVITDAPCESCHFNTATWLGARFNHGTAKSGQCATCHNGRIATGKSAGHTVTVASCDQCHRTSAWVPASWNHNGVTGDCASCHNAAGPGRTFTSATHVSLSLMATMGIANCNACHKNFYSFYSHYYDHAGASTLCETCHGNAAYVGVKQKTSAIHTVTTSMGLSCQSCHKSFASFTNAKYDHSGASTACDSCHGKYNAPLYAGVPAPTSLIHSALLSLPVTTTCNSCHKSFGTFSGAKFDHAGATQCSLCHSGAYASSGIRGKSAGHIAYLSNASECSACHSTSSWGSTVSGASLHNYLTTMTAPHTPTCRSCHNNQAHDGEDGANASMDCSRAGCHDPAGTKGRAFVNWD